MNGKDFAQDAADRLNATAHRLGFTADDWQARDYGEQPAITTIADALAELAERDAALAEIGRIANSNIDPWQEACEQIANIAAKHRAQPDPLVEAFREIQRTPMPPADHWPEYMARDLRAELERLGHGGGL